LDGDGQTDIQVDREEQSTRHKYGQSKGQKEIWTKDIRMNEQRYMDNTSDIRTVGQKEKWTTNIRTDK